MPSPEADLRRVTKRIAELRAQQRALIAQLDLDETDEATIVAALDVAAEAGAFVDRLKGQPTMKQKRTAVNLSRKLSRAGARLEKLPESTAKAAAQAAHAEASDRLLSRVFSA
jgi:hypothetical protein